MLFKLTALVLGTTVALITADVLRVTPDAENVVASRLVGTWVKHVELSERLWGREQKPSAEPLVFRDEPTVVSMIPEEYESFLASTQIYMAGYMTKRGTEHPFLLIQVRGNPHLLWFRERDGNLLGDSESFNLIMAAANSKADDLLFIGGDFNNQPFTAYERKSD